MKNRIYSLCALLCIVLSVSCKKETTEPASNLPKSNHTTARLSSEQLGYIAAVGDQHTKGLQYAYTFLVNLKSTSPGTFDSAIHLLPAVKNGIHPFYTNNELAWISNNSDTAIAYSDAGFDETTTIIGQDPYYWQSHQFWTPDQAPLLSATAQSLLDDLRGIMLDSAKTLEQSLDEIAALEVTANNNPTLDSQELGLVLTATSVGKSSLQYWLQHYSDWTQLVGTSVAWKVATNRTASACARNAGATDVGMLVGGSVTVGIASLFGPVTAVAAWGGIIGGAIGGSVSTAIITWILS
ncbi:MAG: hypothetical protein JST27_08350 [Bacteroidetes bacterium]|nr:hypothetical protein [Bacteroidota bacterium]